MATQTVHGVRQVAIKKIQKKPVNPSEVSSLVHKPPSDHNFPHHIQETSIKHSYEATIEDINHRTAREASSELAKHSHHSEIKNAPMGLEDIFPIDPNIVHSAQVNLAAEQQAAAVKKNVPSSFSTAFYFFDLAATFWGSFWHNFNSLLKKGNQTTSTSKKP